jgi:hypothetical protein
MIRLTLAMAALGLFAAGSASADNLKPGFYTSTGTVASNNGNASCAQVGLTPGAANNSVLYFPGDKKTGLTIYVPLSGEEELCNGFPAVPKAGLNGFSATAQCTVYTLNGNLPAAAVTFAFTATVNDVYSSIGTDTVTISNDAVVGAGCSAVVDTTTVFSGPK